MPGKLAANPRRRAPTLPPLDDVPPSPPNRDARIDPIELERYGVRAPAIVVAAARPSPAPPPPSSGLLQKARLLIRSRHYSPRTEKAYLAWMRRFAIFRGPCAPGQLRGTDVGAFLSHLASEERVSASTQNQAFSALLFLFRDVLGRDLDGLAGVVRAKRPTRVPMVLSRAEVKMVLERVRGTPGLMCGLLYGAGLRLLECCRLRVKDVDFDRGEITVRDGKGRKDRVTVLPARLADAVAAHLERVRRQHASDLERGGGRVGLPDAFERKYPHAGREWGWQWVFPASRVYLDPRTGERLRHHVHESAVQREFASAVHAAGLAKPATCHTLRHSFATHLLESGYDHPHHPGTPWPRGRVDHDDLHPRPQPRRPRRPQPPGREFMTRRACNRLSVGDNLPGVHRDRCRASDPSAKSQKRNNLSPSLRAAPQSVFPLACHRPLIGLSRCILSVGLTRRGRER